MLLMQLLVAFQDNVFMDTCIHFKWFGGNVSKYVLY